MANIIANTEKGVQKIEWARTHMKVLNEAKKHLLKGSALDGARVGMLLHVEAKTAVLAITLAEMGAIVRLGSCNPMSTDNDVSLALKENYGIDVHAWKGETLEEYYKNIDMIASHRPQIIIDDGADLISWMHTKRRALLKHVLGANEETTTGVIRLRAMEKQRKLRFPVIDVNNAAMKHMFDNRYGTGQSTIDGLISATNLLIAGKTAVVAGYGWCGRGIAMRLRGMGANVIVTEVDEIKAVEALLDGFRVMPMATAIKHADIVVTATGCMDVVRLEHLLKAKNGCILCNAGHFDVEISKSDLEKIAASRRKVRNYVEEITTKNGRRLYLLGEGRLVNLVVGQGHPVEIMDMSFSLQLLCADHLANNAEKLAPGVYSVPEKIDRKIAKIVLKTRNIKIDRLTKKQKNYMSSWSMGT